MSGRRTRRTGEQSAPLRAVDQAALHLLELLTYSGWPLTIDELRTHGVSAPAQAIYELQLAGYEIDRVATPGDGGHHSSGYRLHAPVAGGPEPAGSVPSAESVRRSRPGQPARVMRRRGAAPITEVRR